MDIENEGLRKMLSQRILIFVVIVFANSSIANSDVCIKFMAWNDDYPYTFKSNISTRQPQGINIDVVKAIFSKMGCTTKFLKMPWARTLLELEEGRIDIAGGAYFTSQRAEFAHYSTVEIHNPNVLFMRKTSLQNIAINKLSDLVEHKMRIGVQVNVYYGEEYVEWIKQPQFSQLVLTNTSRKALWNMLSLGRVDAVIADLHSGNAEIKQLKLDDKIASSSFVVTDIPAYYIFSKRTTSQEFVHQFDVHLRELFENGTVQRTRAKYLYNSN